MIVHLALNLFAFASENAVVIIGPVEECVSDDFDFDLKGKVDMRISHQSGWAGGGTIATENKKNRRGEKDRTSSPGAFCLSTTK